MPDSTNLTPSEQRVMLAQLLLDKARRQATSVPLSYGQSALWFLHQLQPTSAAYNVMCGAFVRSDVDHRALTRAFQALLGRHAILRTTYGMREGKPVQFVHPRVSPNIHVVDASGWSWEQMEAELQKEADKPFDLERGPVIRIHLFECPAQRTVLLITAHHIAMDFWSFDLVCGELEELYKAESRGTVAELPAVSAQYADYVRWQQRMLESEEGERLYEFWSQQLHGDLPVLDLPTDRPRPAVQTFNGRSHRFHWPDSLAQQAIALARQQGATLYSTLLAVFEVLLHRHAAQQDILVASFTAGRGRAELEPIVGYFLNPIVLRSRLSPEMRFTELLSQVRETALDGVSHQELPFSLLVERLQPARDPSRSPIFQVAFGLDRPRLIADSSHSLAHGLAASKPNTPDDPAVLDLKPFVLGQQGAPLDLMLTMLNMSDSISGALQYNSDLFDESTIVRLVNQYQQLMKNIVADPDQRIDQLQLLTDDQEQILLRDWNDTQLEYSRETCLHQLVERQALQTPTAVAVAGTEEQLTYQELDDQSNQLAHYLRNMGVGPEQLVGICMERSPRMLVGLLGILKAGGAYVPLAPGSPAERLAFMLQDSQAQVVLTQSHLRDQFQPFTGKLVCLDHDWPEIAGQNTRRLSLAVAADHLAYVIFTSGSTGQPKGVQVEHRSVVNFLNSMRREPGISADDTLLAVTTLTFDISVLELFLPLIVGAQVKIVDQSVAADGQQLAELLTQSQATIMQGTPATWRLLLEAGWRGDDQLKVLCGGEALPRDLADQLLPRCASLWNMYGPTETTIWSAVDQVLAEPGPVSIGRPIDNTQIYILDARLRPVPIGVAGDLFIGGDGLARGYLHRPELTADRFVADPFGHSSTARLYKTGDLARYRADGRIVFLGREDFQVKVRGFRIELGEIETHLNQHPLVSESVVVSRQLSEMTDDKQLTAYLVPDDGHDPNVSELRDFLKQRLPAYMIPAVFITLDAIPRNPAGKVDQQLLPAPDATRPRLKTEYTAPRNDLEEQLAEIWASTLDLDEVGVHDDFFELGGASIESLEIAQRLKEAGYTAIPVLIFQYPTVAGLASVLASQQTSSHADAVQNQSEAIAHAEGNGQPRPKKRSKPAAQDQPVAQRPTEKRNTIIESIGVYLPEKELTTDEILKGCKKKMWFPLESMTGIKSRRVVGKGEFSFELARNAIDVCLDNSKYDVDDIDVLINCSISRFDSRASLTAEPSTAIMLQKHFGFENAFAFDITNACAGMFTAILIADAFLNTHQVRRALIVSGEYVSDIIRTAQLEISGFLDSRLACLTVGDAGAALIVEAAADQKTGFHELEMYTLSKYCDMCVGTLTDQPHLGPIMHVADPIKHTAISVEHAVMHAQHVFETSPWAPEDMDLLVLHQTSDRSLRDGMRAINKAFKRKICTWDNTLNNVAHRGNTATTAQFLAVWDNIFNDRVKSGDNAIFGVTGSGQTIGTGIYTFDDLPDRLRHARQTGQFPAKARPRQQEPPLIPSAGPKVQVSRIATLPLDGQCECDTPKMTATAIEACLDGSGYDRSDIELLLFAGMTRSDFILEPATAALIANEVKMNEIIESARDKKTLAFDVTNSSLSFFNACQLATRMIQAGTVKNAMIATSEVNMVAPYSRKDPMNLHETASAVILDVSHDGRQGFGDFLVKFFPEFYDARITRGVFRAKKPDYLFQCDPLLVDYYVKLIPGAVDELLLRAGLDISRIKAVLPSQFSDRLNQGLSERLGIDRERVVDVLEDGKDLFNNSVPYSLQRARQMGLVSPGDLGLVINVAAGIQIGCATYCF